MPIVIAQLLRTVIMALVTALPITALQELIDGTFRKLVDEIRSQNGLSLDEAKDIVTNILVDLSLNAAVVGTVIKTKLAVKTAEYLGLTSKGFAKRTLTTKAEQAVTKIAADSGKSIATKVVGGVSGSLIKIAGGIWLISAIANTIEPGIYKPEQTNAVYKKLGIPFQYPTSGSQLSPGNLDASRFNDLARSLESAGVKGFEMGFPLGTLLYSRQALANAIDYVYGQAILEGKTIKDYRDTLKLIQPYYIGTTNAPNTPTQSTTSQTTTNSPTAVKVFTGIVSSGVVGSGLTFTPRPDDLIENMSELQQAINNNVSPYLAALASKVVYEVKVVPSVIVGGVKKSGQAQTVQVGNYTNGTPKMKTVVNKFAVIDLFFITERNTRTKLTSIVLGPTNALTFSPTGEQLSLVAGNIASNVITTNTDDISTVVSNTPTTNKQPEQVSPKMVTPGVAITTVNNTEVDNTQKQPRVSLANIPFPARVTVTADALRVRSEPNTQSALTGPQRLTKGQTFLAETIVPGEAVENESYWWKTKEGWYLWTGGTDWQKAYLDQGGVQISNTPVAVSSPPPSTTAQSQTQTPVQGSPAYVLPVAALTAQTLSAFFTAIGKPLPSVSERAVLYQSLGLGQSAFYTGTAEQNTNLLNKLKQTGI